MDQILVISLASAAAGFVLGYLVRGIVYEDLPEEHVGDDQMLTPNRRPPVPPGSRDARGQKPRKPSRRN